MDHHNPDFSKLNTQQHVSLEKHDQMIQDALQWQSVSDERENNSQTGMFSALRTRLAGLIYGVMRRARWIGGYIDKRWLIS